MPLFLDRYPFHCWTDSTRTPPISYWSVLLPIFITEANTLPLPNISSQEWLLDTGSRGEAYAWRRHLENAGLDPDIRRHPLAVAVTSAMGRREIVPIRTADLWLVSNVPALASTPFPLRLHRGIPFKDVPSVPDPHLNRPLIDTRALRRAGLRIELDFAQDSVSVWTPDIAAASP